VPAGDELHHFGWNACSSALSPLTGHAFLQRRYLIVPGMRTSRMYIYDTQPDPAEPKLIKTIEPDEICARPAIRGRTPCTAGRKASTSARWAAPAPDGTQGPPGVFIMDCQTFEVLGAGRSTAARRSCTTTSGGTCRATTWCPANGGCRRSSRTASSPRTCWPTSTATSCTSGTCATASTCRPSTWAPTTRWRWRVRPAHDPTREYGFVGVVVDTTNLEASIWTWYRENGKFHARKTATIPPEPAAADKLPPLLKGFGAVPPLVSDIDLSLDDRFLYVACWGTGELRQYDVTDPMKPTLAAACASAASPQHAKHPTGGLRRRPADDGDQPRRQARVLHQLAVQQLGHAVLSRRHPGAQVMCKVGASGGIELDREFFVDFGADYGAHQIRLQGGDCSTDSFCYPSA
jgi:selenium-binding protein 1